MAATSDVGARYLIVNADDFGQSPGINRGIVQAHQAGLVRSVSLMVRWPGAAEAARYARAHPDLSVGLHFDLGEWAFRDGRWVRLYSVLSTNDAETVRAEAAGQLDTFRELLGRDPTHLDSHQHVHQREAPAREALAEMAKTLGVPLRHFSGSVRYCGDFYGQTEDGQTLPGIISVGRLLEILRALRPGFTELGCHPGIADDLDTMYRSERREELTVLSDPSLGQAVQDLGLEVTSFHHLVGVAPRAFDISGGSR